jgi:ketosteroid isomerase-like protein
MRLICAALVAALAAGSAAASDKGDVMATVQKWIDALNRGDAGSAAAVCADRAIIIDEFPPHVWDGQGACSRWFGDFSASNKTSEVTDAVVTVGKARHVDVTGDRAYVVLPASFDYKEKGKPMRDVGATWTFALQKGAAEWRITGWAWSAGKEIVVAPEAPH